MRLNKIKLAGFKSFVDPTTVNLPGNLTGVVGPNGCGKSNVIDAVRWVMGELSAKHLRGDSMADVVFNGSNTRKPVGTASVELLFDNSDGKIGGAYANYSEISLKRVVSRDGTSAYFINGGRCRRKDITQLFLGTGLGSRSYAIIEQGMISRVIEARPDELRSFLEEAAGISLYKERRKETEARVADARENLARVQDLRDEVDKQLRHLQRQASAARRYQELRGRERVLQAELLALRLRDLDSGADVQDSAMRASDLAMQKALADQRAAEAAIEKQREFCAELGAAQSQVQARYYELGAEVSRAEEQIRHRQELREQQRVDAEQTARSLQAVATQLGADRQRHDELGAELAVLGPQAENHQAAEQAANATLADSERSWADWQGRWEQFNRDWGTARQSVQVESARIEQLEAQLHLLTAHADRMQLEHEALAERRENHPRASLVEDEQRARATSVALDAELAGHAAQLLALRAELRQLEQELATGRQQREQQRSELLALEAMQQAALGEQDAPPADWLRESGAGARPRVAAALNVASGWEAAVETALGDYLEAVCVEALDGYGPSLARLGSGRLTLVETTGSAEPAARGSLQEKVQGPASVLGMLSGIQTADSIGSALQRRATLGAGESLITPQGDWIGRHWLRVRRGGDRRSGLLEREQRLKALRASDDHAAAALQSSERQRDELRARIESLEQSGGALQLRLQQAHREHGALQARLEALNLQLDEAAERHEKLQGERAGNATELERTRGNLAAAGAAHDTALVALQQLDSRHPEYVAEREQLQEQLAGARRTAQAAQLTARESLILLESRRTARDSLAQAVARMVEQHLQLEQRHAQLGEALAGADLPLAELQQKLNDHLERRLETESELGAARGRLQDEERQLGELDQQRMSAVDQVEQARLALEQARLQAQESRMRRENLLEQFAATQCDLEQIRAGLAADAGIEGWEQRLADTRSDIERLGSVNLAAIDELKEQSERKAYLDRQYADVSDALATLEEAMRKIDRETRTRFSDTFERVNAGLKEKFPRLFGGGHAYLEVSEDPAANGGVTVMARPPGKRNSTISQLSGGEKALTAVALVFSIFDLNPAPFCLLDEVDAPLDEHNVGRFCDIVREMSGRVQFIFITHNKATMELASQLIGVTMHEPGVSRLVSVDVDEAVRLAAV